MGFGEKKDIEETDEIDLSTKMILDGNLVPPPIASGAFIAQAFTGNECDSVTCQVRKKKQKKIKKKNIFLSRKMQLVWPMSLILAVIIVSVTLDLLKKMVFAKKAKDAI